MVWFNSPSGDVRSWANDTARKLQQLALTVNDKLDLPVKDTSNRTMIDKDGVYAYNGGTTVVSPGLVQIDTQELVDASVALNKLQNGSVDKNKVKTNEEIITQSAQMGNATVLQAAIGDAEIVTAKIADAQITDLKVNDVAVNKLTAGTIGVSGIQVGGTDFTLDGSTSPGTLTVNDGTYDRVEIGRQSNGDVGIVVRNASGNRVFEAAGATDQIDASNIDVNNIDASKINTGTLDAATVDAGTITTGTLDASQATITNIDGGNINADSVTTTQLQADAVTATQIAADAVTATQIAADAVTATKIAADAVTATQIAADAVTANKIDVDAIYAGAIQADAVTATKINVSQIDAISADLGTITAGDISALSIEAGQIDSGTIDAARINVAEKLDVGNPSAGASIGALSVEGGISTDDNISAINNIVSSGGGTVRSAGGNIDGDSVSLNNGDNALVENASGELTLNNASAFVKTSVNGDFFCNNNGEFSGDLTVGGTKPFRIPHPDPEKAQAGYELTHCSVEGPTEGDTLYRYAVRVKDTQEPTPVKLPDYWPHLNKNPQVWVSPADDPAAGAIGWVSDAFDTMYIKATQPGRYNVLLMATRDDAGVQHWKGPETIRYD